MAPKKDDHQDDYYAQVKTVQNTDDGTKKPLKLKLKVVAKKPTESEDAVPSPTMSENVEQSVAKTETHIEDIPKEKPKARLVEREHASE